jgi:hypothetical protein
MIVQDNMREANPLYHQQTQFGTCGNRFPRSRCIHPKRCVRSILFIVGNQFPQQQQYAPQQQQRQLAGSTMQFDNSPYAATQSPYAVQQQVMESFFFFFFFFGCSFVMNV